MEWRVIKMGAEMFDVLHAYGIGVVVAYATNEPVLIQNEGCFYRLSSQCSTVPQSSIDLLDEVFRLPEPEEVLRVQQPHASHPVVPLIVANLDGLLAALFTRPDVVRNCSLAALLHRHRFDPSVIEQAISRIRSICTDWKTVTARAIPAASLWLDEVLKDYDALRPCQPLPGVNQQNASITVTMTLDPSLGYASRQPLSDGRVARKVNVTVRGTRFAALLAYIGAMRFLRAQPVTGSLIAYTVPVASALTLAAESVCPPLWPRQDDEPEQALVLQALDLVTNRSYVTGQWKALSYQVLQAQTKQQAISRSRGDLDLARFEHLKSHSGEQVLRYWQWLLRMPQKERPYELHHLVEALLTFRLQEWEAHLFDVAQAELVRRPPKEQISQKGRLRLYSIDEVQEVSSAMESPLPLPFSTILGRKEGTMRFGHALRQLRREAASSMAREILEDLESVQTRDQLMEALTRTMEICEVMDAKSPFLIVPSDPDLQLLLADVERYGAHTIAGLLRLLSTLRYAQRKEATDQEGGIQIHSEIPDADTQVASTSPEEVRAAVHPMKGEPHDPSPDPHDV